jgi:DNA invertase Pin-like site-specific DNA recombinase
MAVGKIGWQHLNRKACLYVRQSSLAQVTHHRESTARQYNLRERAVALGWAAEQVEVIDEDQGLSGASAVGREGFQRLVSDVALGQVGAVLGLEVSRLARSCADWYRLLEVAALAGTLIVDEEGVYDPNHYNDRLLLGLKGTLSEAELHFLKQRMIGGRRNKALRGEYRIRLPVGYVWEKEAGIRMDPDERVRDTVALFFRCFARLGTAAAVARHFEQLRQPFPRRDGWGSPDVAVSWGPLSWSRAAEILRSPIYAGVYAYARKASAEMDAEDPCAGGRILIPGAHPGYITVEQYERNLARLAGNRNLYGGMRTKGSPREGHSLLQGIVLCGRCGRRMSVIYRRDVRMSSPDHAPTLPAGPRAARRASGGGATAGDPLARAVGAGGGSAGAAGRAGPGDRPPVAQAS